MDKEINYVNGSKKASYGDRGFPLEDKDRKTYTQKRIEHWNVIARNSDTWTSRGVYYHQRLTAIYAFLIPPNQRILEIGCGQGDLLAALRPDLGVGVDFSYEMIRRAKERHPSLHYVCADAHDLEFGEPFDVVIFSDVINDFWDVQQVLELMGRFCTPRTRIVLNFYNRLWEQPLRFAQRLGLATPTLLQNWLSVEDVANLLELADFEIIRHWTEVLWPVPTPFVAPLANRCLVRFWPLKAFALTNFVIARPKPRSIGDSEGPIVSVIVPARNEAENIDDILRRTPEMGKGTEMIFVEGHSKDNTYEVIERKIVEHPERRCLLLRQNGKGKGDAVRLGFARAQGDILMILDADLTVPPEYLPRFYDAIYLGKAEFVNGVRLVYPMENEAMRYLNLLGNKFFSFVFTWLLGQPLKDTLCGTKVLSRENYLEIAKNRGYFGRLDPFGDFDLIFGAIKLNLKIVDLPVRYRKRSYGSTNIRRWRHGWLLLRMAVIAAKRIKFV